VSSVEDMDAMFWGARVKKMYYMFNDAASFNGDISEWDTSSVRDMVAMFREATSFNTDISKWDVSSVQDMYGMFDGAASFNGDISKWDVSSVSDMDEMFRGATAFTQKLCGDAWVKSTASKLSMFEGSSGSISSTACTITTAPPAFSPQSREELQSAVDTHLEHSAKGGDQMHGSEATSPATGIDQGTFVCKPESDSK